MAEVVLMNADDEPDPLRVFVNGLGYVDMPAVEAANYIASVWVGCDTVFDDKFLAVRRTNIKVRGFSRPAVEQKHADLLQLCPQMPGFTRNCKGQITETVPARGGLPLVELQAMYEDRELVKAAG